MQQMIQHQELTRRVHTLSGMTANNLDPIHNLLIKLGILAHGVVDPFPAFNQPGQNFIDIGDWKRIVDQQCLPGLLRPHQNTVPEFLVLVFFLAEKYYLPLLAPGNQRQNGIFLGKTGEVEKIAALAILVLGVIIPGLGSCRRQYGDTVWLHMRHEFLAAPLHLTIIAGHNYKNFDNSLNALGYAYLSDRSRRN